MPDPTTDQPKGWPWTDAATTNDKPAGMGTEYPRYTDNELKELFASEQTGKLQPNIRT